MNDSYTRPRSEILSTLFAFDRVCKERGTERPETVDRLAIHSLLVGNAGRLSEVPGFPKGLAVVFPMWAVAGKHSSPVKGARGFYNLPWDLLDTYLEEAKDGPVVDDNAQARTLDALETAKAALRVRIVNQKKAEARAAVVKQFENDADITDGIEDAV
jgi:hypothetical protein